MSERWQTVGIVAICLASIAFSIVWLILFRRIG